VPILGLPSQSLLDEPLRPRIVGLPASDEARVCLTLTAHRGCDWQSWAIFRTDGAGQIDLAEQAPLAGSYAGADPSGLWWSAEPCQGEPARDDHTTSPLKGIVNVSVRGRTVAAEPVERTSRLPGSQRLDLEEAGLAGTLFLPPTPKSTVAVLVLTGSAGGAAHREAELLAARGFPALALAYFGYPGRPPSLSLQPLEYFLEAIRWLRRHPAVSAATVAVVGHSRGGELALLLAATYPEVGAAVALAGSGLTWGAVDGAATDVAAWSIQGGPVPHVPLSLADIKSHLTFTGEPVSYAPAFRAALARGYPDGAEIPVERARGPLLLVSGDDDAVWPAADLSRIVADRLDRLGSPEASAHLVLADAGHGLGAAPNLPVTSSIAHPVAPIRLALGGTPAGNGRGTQAAWQHTIRFLRRLAGDQTSTASSWVRGPHLGKEVTNDDLPRQSGSERAAGALRT
jgi:dienelactone hydrolase